MRMEVLMSSPASSIKNQFIQAGAGAGKTTQLTEQVATVAIEFYRKNGRFPKIVVTTFTRKATFELKERLFKNVKQILDKKGETAITDEFLKQEFIQRPSRLHISTIHGLFSLFINQQGHYLGINQGYGFFSQQEYHALLKRIFRKVLHQEEDLNHFIFLKKYLNLDTVLRLFSVWNDLMLSTPGTDIVDESFLAKHLGEQFQHFLSQLLGVKDVIATVVTKADSVWGLWVKQIDQKLSEGPFTQLQEFSDFSDFYQKVSSFRNAGKDKIDAELSDQVKDLRKSFELFNSVGNTEEGIQTITAMAEKLKFLFEDFQVLLKAEKKKLNKLRIDDLELMSADLIGKFPITAQNFSANWDYWLVDEFQDTSPLQIKILNRLIADKPCYYVGDPQQSIYLFRGARTEVFEGKQKELEQKQAELKKLMVNYRSRPELLRFINYFFNHYNSNQFSSMLEKTDPHKGTVVEDTAATFCFIDGEYSAEELRAKESELALLQVLRLLSLGVSPKEICILASKKSQLKALLKYSAEIKLPLILHSHSQFFKRQEIQDMISLLKFLVNPHDSINLMKWLKSPFVDLADKWIYFVNDLGSNYNQLTSLWIRLQLLSLKISEVKVVFDKLNSFLQQAKSLPIGYVWQEALFDFSVFKSVYFTADMLQQESNLWKMIFSLREAEKTPGFNYFEFINSLEEDFVDLDADSDADAVPVLKPDQVNAMTIHASKGLQFDYVILLGFGNSLREVVSQAYYEFDEENKKISLSFKNEEDERASNLFSVSIRKKRFQQEKLEYDRLLYVAMTRAKAGVYFVSGPVKPNSWAGLSGITYAQESNVIQSPSFEYKVARFTGENWDDLKRGIPNKPSVAAEIHFEYKTPYVFKGEAKRLLLTATNFTDLVFKGQLKSKGSDLLGDTDPEVMIEGIVKSVSGTKMHRIFESLKFSKDITLLNQNEKKLADYVLTAENGLLKEIIQNGFVEANFSVLHKDFQLVGQIDLWGRDENGKVWIVDYKTGSQKYSHLAFLQLRIYQWALCKMKKITAKDSVSLAVVYPNDKVFKIEKAPTLELIEKELHELLIQIPTV